MTFERRESIFGLPISRWERLPENTATEQLDALEPFSVVMPGRVLGVDIVTVINSESSRLDVVATTRVAESCTTYRKIDCIRSLQSGSKDKVRILGPFPGQHILYRWNGKKS